MRKSTEWIGKIISWYAENSEFDDKSKNSQARVEAFMKYALQQCAAKGGKGNYIYREMSKLPDEKKLRVLNGVKSVAWAVGNADEEFATIVNLAENLTRAEELIDMFSKSK